MTTHLPFTIRAARPDERAAASALTLAVYEAYATIKTPAAWAGLSQAVSGALATTAPHEHLVAERDGVIVGSVLLFPASGDVGGSAGRMVWPELRLLAVTPAARGHGIGEALVRACIERARAGGAAAIGLYTDDTMAAAMALYERLGFTRVPAYDFQPPGGDLVKAYRLPL